MNSMSKIELHIGILRLQDELVQVLENAKHNDMNININDFYNTTSLLDYTQQNLSSYEVIKMLELRDKLSLFIAAIKHQVRIEKPLNNKVNIETTNKTVNVSNNNKKQMSLSHRKFKKLINDPYSYFNDSKNSALRALRFLVKEK